MQPWVPVTEKDITDRWRALTAAEKTIISTVILDAQDELEETVEDAKYPPVDATDERAVRRYKRTIAAMVKRLLVNPDLFISESVEGEYSYRRGDGVETGELFVTPDELARFAPNRRPRRGAFSITLSAS